MEIMVWQKVDAGDKVRYRQMFFEANFKKEHPKDQHDLGPAQSS